MKKTLQRGFTLIELLVVIAIIGILAAVVLASLSDARENGQNASIQTSMNSWRNQMELLYNASNFSYDGACGNGTLAALKTSIDTNGPADSSPIIDAVQTAGELVCQDSASAWAASAPLNDVGAGTKYFCVDSTGASRTVTGVMAAGTNACPAS